MPPDNIAWPAQERSIGKHSGQWLVTTVVVLNLLVLLFGLYWLNTSRRQYEALAATRSQNLVQAIDFSLSSTAEKYDLSLQSIVTELERHSKQSLTNSELIKTLRLYKRKLSETMTLGVTDAFGNIKLDALEGKEIVLNVSQRAYFQQLKAHPQQGLFISEPLQSLNTNEWIIIFSRAYRDKTGAFAGIVMQPIKISYLLQHISQYEVGPHGEVALRDPNMVLIARHKSSATEHYLPREPSPISTELSQLLRTGAVQATYRTTTPFDQIDRLFSYQRLSKAPMYAFVGLAQRDYLAPWYTEVYVSLAFFVLFMAATMTLVRKAYVYWIRQRQTAAHLLESNTKLEQLAHYDPLTGLPNRFRFINYLKQAIEQSQSSGQYVGVCYLDIDCFKIANQQWGSEVGDQILSALAQRLRSSIRPEDIVARLGGDEFAILLNSFDNLDDIWHGAHRLLEKVSNPLTIGTLDVRTTASIGVTVYPDDMEDADTLLRHADHAMYAAKQRGRNRIDMFDIEGERRIIARHEQFAQIVAAQRNNEFCLYYQPKVSMSEGRIIGVEALIRWRHPERGILSPDLFLPIIEGTDFSFQLGEWVIREALSQINVWKTQGLTMPVSVNISGAHLQRPDFVARLSELLSEFPLFGQGMLEFEILETTAMEDIESVSSIIRKCSQLGITFAIDDFGTGYSSLTYLRRLPAGLLKIDRSFVQDMLKEADDLSLVQGIIGLAHSFDIAVLAEGVETIEHGVCLLQQGCDLAQGYGIARPMPGNAIPNWVQQWRPPEQWQSNRNAICQTFSQ